MLTQQYANVQVPRYAVLLARYRSPIQAATFFFYVLSLSLKSGMAHEDLIDSHDAAMVRRHLTEQ